MMITPHSALKGRHIDYAPSGLGFVVFPVPQGVALRLFIEGFQP